MCLRSGNFSIVMGTRDFFTVAILKFDGMVSYKKFTAAVAKSHGIDCSLIGLCLQLGGSFHAK